MGVEVHTDVPMSFADAVRRRRMVRAFTDAPVDAAAVDGLVDLARRAPSAGNSQGCAFVVLSGPDETARYWDVTLPAERRTSFRWPGLVAAPVLVVCLVRPDAWVDRYAEPDKGWSDRDEARWPVPYWYVDAGMAALLVLQTATDAGLGACFFGIPRERLAAFRAEFGVP